MERLTERTPYGICGNNERVTHYPLYKVAMEDPLDHGITGQCFEKLAEYEDLEEQGLLLRLPCKVGDKVYQIHTLPKSNRKVLAEVIADEFFITLCTLEKRFGKTVFLTKEEAESALEKMKGE